MADTLKRGNAAAKGRGFQPGQSGNPGGRVSTAKAWEACGRSASEVTSEAFQILLDGMRDLDWHDKDEAQCKLKCAQTVLAYSAGKPKETIVVTEPEMTAEEYKAEAEEIAREVFAEMTPEERAKLLMDPALSHTIQ